VWKSARDPSGDCDSSLSNSSLTLFQWKSARSGALGDEGAQTQVDARFLIVASRDVRDEVKLASGARRQDLYWAAEGKRYGLEKQ